MQDISTGVNKEGKTYEQSVQDAIANAEKAQNKEYSSNTKESLIQGLASDAKVAEASLKNLSDSFTGVGYGANTAANAIYNVANQLDAMGLHSTAAALRTLGGLLTTFGSIAVAVGAMVKTAGESAMAAWLPLILVIGGAIAAVALIAKVAYDNSLEKQAEDLTTAFKATEQAAKDAK